MNIRSEDQERLEKFISEAVEGRRLVGSIIATCLGISLVNNTTSLMMYLGLGMFSAAGLNALVVLVFVGNAISKMQYQDKQFKMTNAALVSILQSLSIAIASWMSFHEFREVDAASKAGKELFFQELQEHYPAQYKPASDNFWTVGAFVVLAVLAIGTVLCQKPSSSRSEIVKR
jgi:uncharacterized membrane protein YraQ (UPF0718 family)